jgi:hypothetical protein
LVYRERSSLFAWVGAKIGGSSSNAFTWQRGLPR